jgi:tetratricopeptide (TPR) repeat protein
MIHKSNLWVGGVFAGCAVIVAACLVATPAWGQMEYGSAREAYSAGAKLYNMRKYAECREPFEAALRLSDDTQFKVRVYRTLIQSYRQLPEIEKMLEATDFIFEHGESAVAKSLIARDLTSFAHQRGKIQEVVEIHENKLKKNPEDRPALYTLSRIYDRAQPNPKRRAELQDVLKKVQQKDDRKLARQIERLAAEQPNVATRHWKDAAAAWLRAEEKQKARDAARQAEATGPETANDLLAHQWHKGMGDIYLGLDEPKKAIPHYESAIEKTNIAGYIKGCQEKLVKARKAAGS